MTAPGATVDSTVWTILVTPGFFQSWGSTAQPNGRV